MLLISAIIMGIIAGIFIDNTFTNGNVKENQRLHQDIYKLEDRIGNIDILKDAYTQQNDGMTNFTYFTYDSGYNASNDFERCFDNVGNNNTINWSYFNSTKCTLVPR